MELIFCRLYIYILKFLFQASLPSRNTADRSFTHCRNVCTYRPAVTSLPTWSAKKLLLLHTPTHALMSVLGSFFLSSLERKQVLLPRKGKKKASFTARLPYTMLSMADFRHLALRELCEQQIPKPVNGRRQEADDGLERGLVGGGRVRSRRREHLGSFEALT